MVFERLSSETSSSEASSGHVQRGELRRATSGGCRSNNAPWHRTQTTRCSFDIAIWHVHIQNAKCCMSLCVVISTLRLPSAKATRSAPSAQSPGARSGRSCAGAAVTTMHHETPAPPPSARAVNHAPAHISGVVFAAQRPLHCSVLTAKEANCCSNLSSAPPLPPRHVHDAPRRPHSPLRRLAARAQPRSVIARDHGPFSRLTTSRAGGASP